MGWGGVGEVVSERGGRRWRVLDIRDSVCGQGCPFFVPLFVNG